MINLSLGQWFLGIAIIIALIYGSLTLFNFIQGLTLNHNSVDWEAQGWFTIILGVACLILFFLYTWIVAIMWIVSSINNNNLQKLDFFIVVGLISIIGGIFSRNVVTKNNS